jgi:hypothetical protein
MFDRDAVYVEKYSDLINSLSSLQKNNWLIRIIHACYTSVLSQPVGRQEETQQSQ